MALFQVSHYFGKTHSPVGKTFQEKPISRLGKPVLCGWPLLRLSVRSLSVESVVVSASCSGWLLLRPHSDLNLGKTHGLLGKPLMGKTLFRKTHCLFKKTYLKNPRYYWEKLLGKPIWEKPVARVGRPWRGILYVQSILVSMVMSLILSMLPSIDGVRIMLSLVIIHRWRCLQLVLIPLILPC